MKRVFLLLTIVLGGCETTTATAPVRVGVQSSPEERVWLRTDGQRASSSPTLLAKFESDKTACIGDADDVSDQSEDCMRSKGYVFVEQSRAPQLAAEMAARRPH